MFTRAHLIQFNFRSGNTESYWCYDYAYRWHGQTLTKFRILPVGIKTPVFTDITQIESLVIKNSRIDFTPFCQTELEKEI